MDLSLKKREDLISALRSLRLQVKDLKKQLELASPRGSVAHEGFQALWDHTADGIVIVDALTGLIHDCNSQAEGLFGLPRDKLTGTSLAELFGKESRQAVDGLLRACGEQGKKGQCELPLRRNEGARAWVGLSCVAFEAEGSRFAQIAFRDITESKELAEALRSKEEQARMFLGHLPGIAYRGDLHARAEVFYGAVQAITGYTAEEFCIGALAWEDLVVPEDAARFKQDSARLCSQPGCLIEREYRIVCRDGGIRWIWESALNICNAAGRPYAVEGVLLDITARKVLETHLEESERRYRLLTEKTRDFILVVNGGMRVEYVNDALCRQFGLAAKDMAGRPMSDFLSAESFVKRRANIRKVFDSGKNLHVENEVELGGKLFYLDTWVVPLKDARGKVVSAMCISRDISQRKQYEDALRRTELTLREQKLELEKKNIALEEMFRQVELEKEKIRQQVVSNVDTLLVPTLRRARRHSEMTPQFSRIIEAHLHDLVSAFGKRLSEARSRLSQREIEICGMVKAGLSSKDIAHELHISRPTVERHRNNIRRKLGLVKKSVNLSSFLKEQ